MSIDKILIAIFSLAGMAFTYWFFLLKKEEVVSVKNSIDIKVEGGYSPDTISIPKGKTTKINCFRKDHQAILKKLYFLILRLKSFCH